MLDRSCHWVFCFMIPSPRLLVLYNPRTERYRNLEQGNLSYLVAPTAQWCVPFLPAVLICVTFSAFKFVYHKKADKNSNLKNKKQTSMKLNYCTLHLRWNVHFRKYWMKSGIPGILWNETRDKLEEEICWRNKVGKRIPAPLWNQ